ncbi:hypothetical protein ACOSP7_004454 [Xanthoceras sorbifolium]
MPFGARLRDSEAKEAPVQHPTGIELVISPPTYNVQYPPMGDVSISVNAFNAGVNASANVEGQIYLKASNPHGPPIRDVKAKDDRFRENEASSGSQEYLLPVHAKVGATTSESSLVPSPHKLSLVSTFVGILPLDQLYDLEVLLNMPSPIRPTSSRKRTSFEDAPEDKGKGAAIPPSQDSVVLDEFLTL